MRTEIMVVIAVVISMLFGFVIGRAFVPKAEVIEEITYSPDTAKVVEIIEYNSIAVTDTEGNEWYVAVDMVDCSPVEENVTVEEMIKRFEK